LIGKGYFTVCIRDATPVIKSAFGQGAISDYWRESIQPEKWFDPAFRDFINKEVIKKD
jgi:hypothetical protein